MAIYISLNLALPLAVIYFKPTTWLKPCSNYGPCIENDGLDIKIWLLKLVSVCSNTSNAIVKKVLLRLLLL